MQKVILLLIVNSKSKIIVSFAKGFENDWVRFKTSSSDTSYFLTTERSSAYAGGGGIDSTNEMVKIYLNDKFIDSIKINYNCLMIEINKKGNDLTFTSIGT